MRFALRVGLPWLATLAFWAAFVACIDTPLEPAPPAARVQATWDPLRCGRPYRVVIELEDEGGAPSSSSSPCVRGGLTLDLAHFGVYLGRVYAWEAGQVRSVTPVRLAVDEPVLHWQVETPR
ncbi:MAG: hypothetical protein KF773_21455 [Deltaproteobacteria bacterium]|nr:hypothetical protein [Deltaproteobacteria bacterium]MCW5802755.1 hypothetical protein [Deltaproteobacteria bacterium]